MTTTHTLHFPPRPGPISFDQITDADRGAIRALGVGAKLVIEIGTFLGGSAEAFFETMPEDGHLVTIDTFCGTLNSGVTDMVPTEKMLTYAVGRLSEHRHRMTVIVGDSITTAALFSSGIADVVFVDAGHDYDRARADIDAWLPKVKPGGIMAGHDFDKVLIDKSIEWLWERRNYEMYKGTHPGVMLAVRDKFESVVADGDTVWRVRV